MTEEPQDKNPSPDPNPGPDAPPEPTKPVTLTQEELNRLIGGARTDAKASYEKEIAKIREEHERSLRLASMKEEERAKAEKEIELKKLTDELSEYKRALALKDAEAELAKLGLDASFASVVLGADGSATAANIAALKKQVDGAVKRQIDEAVKAGAPNKGAAPPNASLAESIRKAAGLPPKK
ncbi:MAG: DUF4355 domain-containing protein [Candidatus Methanoplasma sp.]|jgi:hypothetical protein|nr:DUF4355 domain-containing protein [Candidatus Methanoplasma sp.]